MSLCLQNTFSSGIIEAWVAKFNKRCAPLDVLVQYLSCWSTKFERSLRAFKCEKISMRSPPVALGKKRIFCQRNVRVLRLIKNMNAFFRTFVVYFQVGLARWRECKSAHYGSPGVLFHWFCYGADVKWNLTSCKVHVNFKAPSNDWLFSVLMDQLKFWYIR